MVVQVNQNTLKIFTDCSFLLSKWKELRWEGEDILIGFINCFLKLKPSRDALQSSPVHTEMPLVSLWSPTWAPVYT